MSQLNDVITTGRTVKTALLDGAERNVVVSFGSGEATLTTSDGNTLKTSEGDVILVSSETEAEAISGVIQSGSLKLSRKLCSKEDLAFGECNPAQFSVDIYNIGDVAGKEIEVYELIEGYKVNLFKGKVDSSKLNPEQNYRSIEAYDALYEAKQVDVKQWYDSYFASTQKEEYKGVWGQSQYYYPQVVKYNNVYYQYINTLTDEFIRKDGQTEFIENVTQYLTGKTPEEIMADSSISKYISKLDSYEPNNYTPVTLLQFRNDLFSYVGIEQVQTKLVNDYVRIGKTINAESILFGTLLQNICQMCGVFGMMTPTGKFRYVDLRDKWETQEVLFPSGERRIYTGGVETVDYSDNYVSNGTTYEEFTTDLIDSVKIFNANNAMVSYAGALNSSNSLDIVGNLLLAGLDSSVLDVVSQKIFDLVKNLTYTPLKLSAKVSMPIDLGSFITFTSHTGQTVKSIVLNDNWSNAQMVDQSVSSSGGKKRKDSSKVSNDLQKAIKNTLDIALVDIYERINSNGAMIKRLDANSGSYMVEVKRRDDETGSKFEQTASKISWIIKSGTGESNFTLTDRMAALVANSVDISGLVTFKEKIESGSETVINGGAIKTGSIKAESLKVGSLTASLFQIAAGQNLLSDVDSFEVISDDLAVSDKVGQGTIAISSEAAFAGRKSLKIAPTALSGSRFGFVLGNSSYSVGRVFTQKGKYYIVSFYLKSSVNGVTGTCYAKSYNTLTSRGGITSGTYNFTYNDSSNGWQRFYFLVQGDSSYNYLGLEFQFGSSAVGATMYLDGIQVEQAEATNQLPSYFKNGSVTSINGASIITGSITAEQLAADIVRSRNYSKTSYKKFSDAGTYLDLNTGAITSTVLYIDANGNAGFKGSVEATELSASKKGTLSVFSFDEMGMYARLNRQSIVNANNDIELSAKGFIYSIFPNYVVGATSTLNREGVIRMYKSEEYVQGDKKPVVNFTVDSNVIDIKGKHSNSVGDTYTAIRSGRDGMIISSLESAEYDTYLGSWGGAGNNVIIQGQDIIFGNMSYEPALVSNLTDSNVYMVINKSGNVIIKRTLSVEKLMVSSAMYSPISITVGNQNLMVLARRV